MPPTIPIDSADVPAVLDAAWEAWTGHAPRALRIRSVEHTTTDTGDRTTIVAEIHAHWRPVPIERTIHLDHFASIDRADEAHSILAGEFDARPDTRPSTFRSGPSTVVWMAPVPQDALRDTLRKIDPIACLAVS